MFLPIEIFWKGSKELFDFLIHSQKKVSSKITDNLPTLKFPYVKYFHEKEYILAIFW